MAGRSGATADGYTSSMTLEGSRPANSVLLQVMNAPVLAQFKLVPKGLQWNRASAEWEPLEEEMVQGVWTWSPLDFDGREIMGVRVRSEVTGKPAQVTMRM